jgi:hypothetical protein
MKFISEYYKIIMSSQDDSDTELAKLSSDEEVTLPAKRKSDTTKTDAFISKLPNVDDLLSKPAPSFLNNLHLSSTKKRKIAHKEVISKPPVFNKSEHNPIEQYEYFASTGDAILDYWNAPQEFHDKETVPDKRHMRKKVDIRRKATSQPHLLPDEEEKSESD